MKNKVLIKVIVPELDLDYDLFIPVNEIMWKINKLVTKSIFDLSGLPFDPEKDNYILLNKDTGMVYGNNEVVINTNIRNGSELILLSATSTS